MPTVYIPNHQPLIRPHYSRRYYTPPPHPSEYERDEQQSDDGNDNLPTVERERLEREKEEE